MNISENFTVKPVRQVSTASVRSEEGYLERVSTFPRMLRDKPNCKGGKCAGTVL